MRAKSILTRTKLPGIDYTLNPYFGCGHRCVYCYVPHFLKLPYPSKPEPKENAVELLRREVLRKKPGHVLISSATDPYQPLERRWMLTQKILKIFATVKIWKITILTKSDLVLRDIEILKSIPKIEVGLTITTDRENVRRIFEPFASPISNRINALKVLKSEGIRTYAFIAPFLPMNPRRLAELIEPHVDYVLIDVMHYRRSVSKILVKYGFDFILSERWQEEVIDVLRDVLGDKLAVGSAVER